MATRTDDLRALLRRRAGWKVSEDGNGARYQRRGASWSGLVHRLAGEDRGAQWHAALIEHERAQVTTRWWYASDAVAWVEAHE